MLPKRTYFFFEHEPYKDLVLRTKDLTGWSPTHEVYDKACDLVDARVIVEVGVWKGVSAAHMAHWLKKRGIGILFAVDTWTGALEFWTRRITKGEYDHDVTYTGDMVFPACI